MLQTFITSMTIITTNNNTLSSNCRNCRRVMKMTAKQYFKILCRQSPYAATTIPGILDDLRS